MPVQTSKSDRDMQWAGKPRLALTQKNRNPKVTVFVISHIKLAINARPRSWLLIMAVPG